VGMVTAAVAAVKFWCVLRAGFFCMPDLAV